MLTRMFSKGKRTGDSSVMRRTSLSVGVIRGGGRRLLVPAGGRSRFVSRSVRVVSRRHATRSAVIVVVATRPASLAASSVALVVIVESGGAVTGRRLVEARGGRRGSSSSITVSLATRTRGATEGRGDISATAPAIVVRVAATGRVAGRVAVCGGGRVVGRGGRGAVTRKTVVVVIVDLSFPSSSAGVVPPSIPRVAGRAELCDGDGTSPREARSLLSRAVGRGRGAAVGVILGIAGVAHVRRCAVATVRIRGVPARRVRPIAL